MTLTDVLNPLARREVGGTTYTLAGAVIGRKYSLMAVADRAEPVQRSEVRCVLATSSRACTSFIYYASLTAAWDAFQRATTPRGGAL